MKIERIDPYEHLEDWERLYFESLRNMIFAYPRWSVLSAEYSGGEPIYWKAYNEKPVGYFAGVYYEGRNSLIIPAFDPLFAPYSDFVISPPYRREVLTRFIETLKGNYEKIFIGPIREDSPNFQLVSSNGKPISSQKIRYMRMKGDPLEHLYRHRAYDFITSFENMDRKLDINVEIKGFEVLDRILSSSYKLSPSREFALKSVLASCKENVKIIEVIEKGKTLGYTVILDVGDTLYVIMNTVPENKILLGIWRYLYDAKKRDVILEIPTMDQSLGKDLGFKTLSTHIYEIV